MNLALLHIFESFEPTEEVRLMFLKTKPTQKKLNTTTNNVPPNIFRGFEVGKKLPLIF